MREPGWEAFEAAREAETTIIGAPTLFEFRRVLAARGFSDARALIDAMLDQDMTIRAFGEADYRFAEEAYERYGRGRGGGSEASVLNLFDCMTYGTARAAGQPLLFKGDDFAVTDLTLHPACQDGRGAPLGAR